MPATWPLDRGAGADVSVSTAEGSSVDEGSVSLLFVEGLAGAVTSVVGRVSVDFVVV